MWDIWLKRHIALYMSRHINLWHLINGSQDYLNFIRFQWAIEGRNTVTKMSTSYPKLQVHETSELIYWFSYIFLDLKLLYPNMWITWLYLYSFSVSYHGTILFSDYKIWMDQVLAYQIVEFSLIRFLSVHWPSTWVILDLDLSAKELMIVFYWINFGMALIPLGSETDVLDSLLPTGPS